MVSTFNVFCDPYYEFFFRVEWKVWTVVQVKSKIEVPRDVRNSKGP